jgi:methylated-DNA-protein-cysteine methyltransferase-like protein
MSMVEPSSKKTKAGRRAAFDARVYELCRLIPAGRVTTYGWIAAAIDPPGEMEPLAFERIKARWVGYALARCPIGVPWHRVINYQGGLSLKPGREHQRALLEDEGIHFAPSGRVDLEHYGWKP